MRYAIKRIRMRAGVPDYTNETYKNQADFRVKLKRERQVELLEKTVCVILISADGRML